MRVVGLTGGSGAGKSSLAALLAARGVEVVDTDALAREVTVRGRWGWRRVAHAFPGAAVLAPDGELDRPALAALVFTDAAARRRLNAATHLPIAVALAARLLCAWLRCVPVVVVDVPLLFESGIWRLTRPNVVVAAPAAAQAARLAERDGLDAAAVAARLGAQMGDAERRRRADVVLGNAGGLAELEAAADALAARLRAGGWVHRWLFSPVGVAVALLVLRRVLLR
jgi:dephospho-CoA kinase